MRNAWSRRHVLLGTLAAAGLRAIAFARGETLSAQDDASLYQNFLDKWRRAKQSKDAEEKIAGFASALDLEAKIKVWPSDAMVRQQARGLILVDLGNSYANRKKGERNENLRTAVSEYKQALDTYPANSLHDRANAELDLAICYVALGEDAEDWENAIAACEAALQFFNAQTFPQKWADAQVTMGVAYLFRTKGVPSENGDKAVTALEAALTVTPKEKLPQNWARIQVNLGLAYLYHVRGSQTENLEQAIGFFSGAITVLNRDDQAWANAHSNLGLAYLWRIRGDRVANLERAIAETEAALEVLTNQSDPYLWASAQNNLGNAYSARIEGDAADNLNKAAAAYGAAQTVFTRQFYPREWAGIEINLGLNYISLAKLKVKWDVSQPEDYSDGINSQNVEDAIDAFNQALDVRTREKFPFDWAHTQFQLGKAFAIRVAGERAANIEKAIALYNLALEVFKPDVAPQPWAQTQIHLGVAYTLRVNGTRASNLARAVGAYTSALGVLSLEASPSDNLLANRLLGHVLLEMGQWSTAQTAFANGRSAFNQLFGLGLEADEAQSLIQDAGPLFAESAYAHVQTGDLWTALGLLSEGKAHMLDVSLRRRLPNLGIDDRTKLAALAEQIREHARLFNNATGTAAIALLDQLKQLRNEAAQIIEAELAKETAVSPMAMAGMLLSDGEAIVAPIATSYGGKILIVLSAKGRLRIDVLDLPKLTATQISQLMGGDTKSGSPGWVRTYADSSQGIEKDIGTIADLEPFKAIPVLAGPLKQAELDCAQLTAKWYGAIEAVAAALWGLFAGDLCKALLANGVEQGARIMWLPPGALGLVPLGIAKDPVSHQRFADLYEITYAPNLKAMTTARKVIKEDSINSIAVVGYGDSNSLPFAHLEEAVVGSHFPQNSLVRLDDATAQSVLAALPASAHWHFACHGAFDFDDASNSALLLSKDRKLTLKDLIAATEGGKLSDPRLVVLSACETGLYDVSRTPDEFIGLPNAFMALGAAGVLSTMWLVDDRATLLLVAKFYELHFGEKVAPAAALRKAQGWLRTATKGELISYTESLSVTQASDGLGALRDSLGQGAEDACGSPLNGGDLGSTPFAHPYYWGAFVYLGA